MELNRDQTIKALKHLVDKYGENGSYNTYVTLRDALSLIKELTEESKKWEQAYDCMDSACRELSSKCDRLSEEKEKLGLLIDELEKEKRELWEERNRIYNDLQDWKAIAEQYQKQFEDCAEDRAKLTEENERLRADNKTVAKRTVRKFVKMLKSHDCRCDSCLNEIKKEIENEN